MDKITVVFDKIGFYSQLDECLFFCGLNKVPGVTVIDAITFEIDKTKLPKEQYYQLGGLIKRYFSKKKSESILQQLYDTKKSVSDQK